jgi:hypothetical protein
MLAPELWPAAPTLRLEPLFDWPEHFDSDLAAVLEPCTRYSDLRHATVTLTMPPGRYNVSMEANAVDYNLRDRSIPPSVHTHIGQIEIHPIGRDGSNGH